MFMFLLQEIEKCSWIHFRMRDEGDIYIYLDPPVTSFLKVKPPQNKAFSNQNRCHLGSRYIKWMFGDFQPIFPW